MSLVTINYALWQLITNPSFPHANGQPNIKLLIFDTVSRLFAISLLVLYINSNTEFHEMLRLPILLEHYRQHQQQVSDISFWDFLVMHYQSDVSHDSDDNQLNLLSLQSTARTHCLQSDCRLGSMIIHHNSLSWCDCRWHKQGRTSTKLHGMYSDKDLLMVILIDVWWMPLIMQSKVSAKWVYASCLWLLG